MKNKLIYLIAVVLLFYPKINFAQSPTLGSAADFVLFTSVGAVTNTGISQVTGDVGSNLGAGTGFANVNGVMQSQNAATVACSTDVLSLYNQLNLSTATIFPSATLGGDTLYAGIYSVTGASSLTGTLTLDAQGNPNAVFIFKLEGAFSAAANAKVVLINGALACNVFWKIEGLTSIATGVSMRGNIVTNNAAIAFAASDTLEGRAFSTSGAISVSGIMAFTPLGGGIPILTGPVAPTLGTAANYVLFTGIGALTNTGATFATGEIGTNSGLTTGFDPAKVNGIIHPIPDASTGQCATDLAIVYSYLFSLTADIELLYPAQFGNALVLTPHTYLLNAATTFTDTLFLNAQGNADAVFVIKIFGALTTSTYSNVVLINGAQSRNVYWLVSGAASININSFFRGTLVANNGAINFTSNAVLDGRALTTVGALGVSAITAIAPISPVITNVSPASGVVGATITITGLNFNSIPANNIVFFGATMATVSAATTTSLIVTVPEGAIFAYVTELNTGTNLSASSKINFNPIYSPAKSGITSTDFAAKQDFTTGASSNPLAVSIGDLNGDGKADLAIANYGTNSVSVFVNTSISGSINSGSFAAKADFTTGGGSYGIKLGDIDDDGKPDMVVSCFGYIVSVLRNTSSGGALSFAAKVDFGVNQNSTSVTLGDLDGDGKMDMVITNAAPNNISVFRNISTVGNITFATKVDYSTGTGPESVVIGDLDGDGRIDLAVANQTSNSVSVFLNTSNTGTISLADRVSFTTGTTPYNLTIGDLDGDGKLDLAVANDGSNTVSILRNTSTISTLSFATKVDFTTGLIPVSVAMGDIDGDGKADLAITNRTANSVSVLTNTSSIGSISFAAKVDFTTGSGAEFVAIGDLDGDGKPELAIANSGSNSVSVLHNEDIKFYYTQGSGNPANLINWNSAIDGSGSAPINLISAATYIIQNSHTITTIGTMFFGTSGSVLEIQNGGILVANHAITMASGSNYQLDAGSLFNMNASLTVDSILLVGGKLVIGSGATLTLNGPVITTAGVFSGSTSSNLIIGSDIGTLLFDQTTPGTTNVLHVLTIGFGSAASLTLGNNLNIDPTGKISFNAAGAKSLTTTGQTLTLLSTSLGSAMIDNTNGATITGLINAQNYLPASGRKYRFLASPLVGGTSMEWRNNGVNTSGEGIAITGSTGIVDSSVSHQSSAFYYLETNTNEGTNINGSGKWPAIDGNTSLVNGAGYRVFVRGDRTISLLTANTINNPTTIWVQGTYPANPISPTITYTTAAANGWNLVGNPYPCTLNWDLVTGGDRTNIDNAIYIWHPANTNNTSGGYASYVNGIGTGTPNAGTAYISSGQAFFVKANAASPVLNIRESHKESAEAGGRIFKAGNLKPNSIRLNLSNDTQKLDDAVLYFENGATTNFDGEFDAFDLTNNIGFLTDDGKDTLSISGNPMYTGNETYKINARLGSGNYKIQFTDLNSFVSLPEAYLVDKYLDKALLLADKASYSFIVYQNNPFTYGSDRFELQFGKMPTGLLNNDNQNSKLIVFPNPANDVLNLSLSRINTIEHIRIYDALGKLVISLNASQTQIDISPINTGVYTIEVITSNGRFITKFIK